MKMPRYIFPLTFCDDCRKIGLKSKFKRHDDKYMFRAHYLCRHCSGDSIADRYLVAKSHRKAMDLQRKMWNEMKKHLEK